MRRVRCCALTPGYCRINDSNPDCQGRKKTGPYPWFLRETMSHRAAQGRRALPPNPPATCIAKAGVYHWFPTSNRQSPTRTRSHHERHP